MNQTYGCYAYLLRNGKSSDVCVVSACTYASMGETVRGPSGNVELGHHTVSTAQSKVHFRWICPITEIALFWGRTRSIVPWRSLSNARSLPSSQKRAVTQRKYLSSGWQAVNEGQKQEKLTKTALPGAMVTEGQWPGWLTGPSRPAHMSFWRSGLWVLVEATGI